MCFVLAWVSQSQMRLWIELSLSLFRYFPYEEENDHKLVKEIGNVMEGQEITFQFAIKPEFNESKTFSVYKADLHRTQFNKLLLCVFVLMTEFLKRKTVPFQLQLSFKTGDGQRVTRIATEQRPVTASR